MFRVALPTSSLFSSLVKRTFKNSFRAFSISDDVTVETVNATDASSKAYPYVVNTLDHVLGNKKKLAAATSRVRDIPGHTKKLVPLTNQIKGLPVQEACVQLSFSNKKRSDHVRNAIIRASRIMEIRQGVAAANQIVDIAIVNKQTQERRLRYHSRGRAGIAYLRTAQAVVRLREMVPVEQRRADEIAKSRQGVRNLDPRVY